MAITKVNFTNPPIVEVKAIVQFPNNLRVADDRFGFHEIIKAEFPVVVMPELKQLQYDFGDYSVYTDNQAYRLEISMNYFRLASTAYRGFQEFRQMYLAAVSMFVRHYHIPSFDSFTLQYTNRLVLPPDATFGGCFAVKIEMPEGLQAKLATGSASLLFDEGDGFVMLELNPQLLAQPAESWGINLTFLTQQRLSVSEDCNQVGDILERAHTRLTDFFFSALKPEIVEHLMRSL